MTDIQQKNITIIGAGLMGHGIALVMARAGHRVSVTDPVLEAREGLREMISHSFTSIANEGESLEEVLARVSVYENLADAVNEADFVFEAAPEKVDLKQQIFAQIEKHAPSHCIFASNTSVIQISKIMKGLETRERCVGTHWWNPPHLIPLVEVVKTQWSDPQLADEMMQLLEGAGKTPVMVEKDVPGFIGNRLQHALWREAISLVENGVCDAAAVDTVIKSSFGRRLAVLGPLENADLVGVDLTQDIHENVLFDLDRSQEPSPYLQKLLDQGRLGMKSKAGFYDWQDQDADKIRQKVSQHLNWLSEVLEQE